MAVKLPTINQLISLLIALAIISFVMKLMPENIKALFRI